ncbi:sugar phosphate isomerase/epimerase family protein [Jiangella muralis]|uniref:sugar phosphate isomerase/epimerase family protein n=1 Tax=Jiangella muralis TaxID=702383 RepID=UPI00069DDC4A|nr:sugar phosphate isomerase/epimerase [Jiangella muralis]
MPKPLAVQLYSVRDLLSADRSGVLRRLAAIGFGAVEPYDPCDDPEGLWRVLDDLGLEVCASHAVGLVRGGDAAEIFDAVRTLGTELVIVPGGLPTENFATADGIARVADLLNEWAGAARGHGLRLGYHNHDHELRHRVDGRHALDVLADLLDPDVFLEVDTYWAAVGGADVPALLSRHAGRVRLLHIKDGPAVLGEPNVAVGAGALPVADYLATAPDAWRIVEFDTCATDLLAAIDDSYRHLAALEPV